MVGNCISLFRTDLLTLALRFVSLFGDGVWIPVALTIFAAALVYYFKKDKAFSVILLLAPLVGQIVKSLLKNYYQVPRPEAFGCEVLVNYADKYSFPSGHTIFYTIFFGLLAYYAWQNRRELWAKFVLPVSLALVVTVGYSRIYLGVHWYLDIFGGYVLGGAMLAMAILVHRYLSGKSESRVLDKSGNVRSAGAIVSRNKTDKVEYLLVYRNLQKDYSFPKGRLEKGESAEKAAIREILEETGYKIEITKHLEPIAYNYPEGGGVVVEMFEGAVTGEGEKIETNEEVVWVSVDKVIELLTYPNLKTYFAVFLRSKIK